MDKITTHIVNVLTSNNLTVFFLIAAAILGVSVAILSAAGVVYAFKKTPRRMIKFGAAILLMIIGFIADASWCWGLVSILIFALILKKGTIIEIIDALSNDGKEQKGNQ